VKHDIVIVACTGYSAQGLHGIDLREYGFVIGVNTYWMYGLAHVYVVDDKVFERNEYFKEAAKEGRYFYNRESADYGEVYEHKLSEEPIMDSNKLAWWHSGCTPAINLAMKKCNDGGTIGLIGIDFIPNPAFLNDYSIAYNEFEKYISNCCRVAERSNIKIVNYSDISKVKSIPCVAPPWEIDRIERRVSTECMCGSHVQFFLPKVISLDKNDKSSIHGKCKQCSRNLVLMFNKQNENLIVKMKVV